MPAICENTGGQSDPGALSLQLENGSLTIEVAVTTANWQGIHQISQPLEILERKEA